MRLIISGISFVALVTAQVPAGAEQYQQILSCDNGAAVVDIDNRQNVQLIVRDQNIVGFLYNKGTYDRSLVRQNCFSHGDRLHCDPPKEIIIRGRNRIEKGSQSDPGNLPGYPYYLGVFGSGLGSRQNLRFYREGAALTSY